MFYGMAPQAQIPNKSPNVILSYITIKQLNLLFHSGLSEEVCDPGNVAIIKVVQSVYI